MTDELVEKAAQAKVEPWMISEALAAWQAWLERRPDGLWLSAATGSKESFHTLYANFMAEKINEYCQPPRGDEGV